MDARFLTITRSTLSQAQSKFVPLYWSGFTLFLLLQHMITRIKKIIGLLVTVFEGLKAKKNACGTLVRALSKLTCYVWRALFRFTCISMAFDCARLITNQASLIIPCGLIIATILAFMEKLPHHLRRATRVAKWAINDVIERDDCSSQIVRNNIEFCKKSAHRLYLVAVFVLCFVFQLLGLSLIKFSYWILNIPYDVTCTLFNLYVFPVFALFFWGLGKILYYIEN